MVCRNCGNPVMAGEMFCGNCGQKIENDFGSAGVKYVCSGCGLEWEEGVMFCGECGSAVVRIEPDAPSAAEPPSLDYSSLYGDTAAETVYDPPVRGVPDVDMITGTIKTTIVNKEPFDDREIADREEGKKFWHRPDEL